MRLGSNLRRSPAAPRELISYLWDSIVVVIPRCLEYDGKTQYFFNTARAFLMATLQDDERRPHLDVNGYLQVWCNILLRHVHVEVSLQICCARDMLSLSRMLAVMRLIGL